MCTNAEWKSGQNVKKVSSNLRVRARWKIKKLPQHLQAIINFHSIQQLSQNYSWDWGSSNRFLIIILLSRYLRVDELSLKIWTLDASLKVSQKSKLNYGRDSYRLFVIFSNLLIIRHERKKNIYKLSRRVVTHFSLNHDNTRENILITIEKWLCVSIKLIIALNVEWSNQKYEKEVFFPLTVTHRHYSFAWSITCLLCNFFKL